MTPTVFLERERESGERVDLPRYRRGPTGDDLVRLPLARMIYGIDHYAAALYHNAQSLFSHLPSVPTTTFDTLFSVRPPPTDRPP